MARRLLIALTLALTACASPKQSPRTPEATSLLGRPLFLTSISPDQRSKLEADLAAAQAAFDKEPSETNTIWLGRRLAYLGRYNDAIAVFTRGLETYPNSAKLYRHRGHRYITVRQIDASLRDLSQAAILTRSTRDEIEPDGAPNARNIPRSSLRSNIWYHLGLGHYLNGEFSRAATAWTEALKYSRINDDMLVATTYWLYVSRKRAGDHAGATAALRDIRLDMDVIENHNYHRLLLCFKGDLKSEEVGQESNPSADAGIAYGLAVRKLLQDDTAAAKADFERIIAGDNWPAFGYIAAEAELARMRGR
jgi:tetratricopeptide (TPR) repeat protein